MTFLSCIAGLILPFFLRKPSLITSPDILEGFGEREKRRGEGKGEEGERRKETGKLTSAESPPFGFG